MELERSFFKHLKQAKRHSVKAMKDNNLLNAIKSDVENIRSLEDKSINILSKFFQSDRQSLLFSVTTGVIYKVFLKNNVHFARI